MIYTVFVVSFGIVLFSSLVSAGLGIKYSEQSVMVKEGETACLTYGVYNPWDDQTYATIGLSDNLKEILTVQDVESKVLPAQTSSDEAIPIKFCFKVPRVYSRDCSVGSFICEQTCEEPQVEYSGEVVVSSIPAPTQITGAGGSATKYAVGAPLTVRVSCTPHGRDYTLVYVLLALISALVIAGVLFKKYRKPKSVRDKEKIAKLKAEIAKEEGKKKPAKKASVKSKSKKK